MNQSAAVNQSITLSWKGKYTAHESSQNRIVVFKRYAQNNSSVVVQIGGIAIIPHVGPKPFFQTPFRPHIDVVLSASPISEPAITIQDVTKQDEVFYRIEVIVGSAVVASYTIFLTVFGNYVHSFVMFTCTYSLDFVETCFYCWYRVIPRTVHTRATEEILVGFLTSFKLSLHYFPLNSAYLYP